MDYGRRITEVAGKKDKRCATNHAEVCTVKYVEYCKDAIEETLERLNIIRTLHKHEIYSYVWRLIWRIFLNIEGNLNIKFPVLEV